MNVSISSSALMGAPASKTAASVDTRCVLVLMRVLVGVIDLTHEVGTTNNQPPHRPHSTTEGGFLPCSAEGTTQHRRGGLAEAATPPASHRGWG